MKRAVHWAKESGIRIGSQIQFDCQQTHSTFYKVQIQPLYLVFPEIVGMGKHKKSINLCKACGIRHAAPRGAKCDRYRDDSSSSTQGSPRRRGRRNDSGGGSPRTDLGSPSRNTGCNSERSLSGEESPSEVRDKRSLADLLLEKMTEMRDEARAQLMADKAELQKAIADLASRVDCSILCSDDEGAGPARGTKPRKVLTDGASGTTGDRMTGVSGSGGVMGDPAGNAVSNTNAIIVICMPAPAGGTSFARPAGKKTGSFATRVTQHQIQTAGDPIGRLRGDETSVAQARIVVGAGGVTLQGIEGTNVQSGYYRTLNDSKVYDVPWPNLCNYTNLFLILVPQESLQPEVHERTSSAEH